MLPEISRKGAVLKLDISQLLAPQNKKEKPDLFTKQKVDLLRQFLKEDIDKRLDQFLVSV